MRKPDVLLEFVIYALTAGLWLSILTGCAVVVPFLAGFEAANLINGQHCSVVDIRVTPSEETLPEPEEN